MYPQAPGMWVHGAYSSFFLITKNWKHQDALQQEEGTYPTPRPPDGGRHLHKSSNCQAVERPRGPVNAHPSVEAAAGGPRAVRVRLRGSGEGSPGTVGSGGLPGLGGGRNRWSPEDAQGRARSPCDPGVVAAHPLTPVQTRGEPAARTDPKSLGTVVSDNLSILVHQL